MELLTRAAWLFLAALHAVPAIVLFQPALIERLYGVSPLGAPGMLIVHRGALFLALVVAAVFALLDPAVRSMASVIVAISVVGFLVVYARAGFPAGSLRTIAIADAVALLPLGFVMLQSWRGA